MKQPLLKPFSIHLLPIKLNHFCSVKRPKNTQKGLGSGATTTCQSTQLRFLAASLFRDLKFGFISTVKPAPQDSKSSLRRLNKKILLPQNTPLAVMD